MKQMKTDVLNKPDYRILWNTR